MIQQAHQRASRVSARLRVVCYGGLFCTASCFLVRLFVHRPAADRLLDAAWVGIVVAAAALAGMVVLDIFAARSDEG